MPVSRSGYIPSFLLVVILVLLQACSSRPDNVIPPKEMASLLADVHKAEGVIETSPRSYLGDSAKRAFRQSVYARHGYTTAQVDSSLVWYGYNMEIYIEVYDRVIEILESDLARAQEKMGSAELTAVAKGVPMEGDSVNVWTGPRYRRLASNMPSDNMSFLLSTDRYWEKGDVYTFSAKFLDTQRQIIVNIAADYGDGKKEFITRRLNGDGWHTVVLALDSARAPQRVYGNVMYPAQGDGKVAFVDSITLMRTRWNGTHRPDREAIKTVTYIR